MAKTKKTILLSGQKIAYTKYKRRGTKHLRISVSGGGQISVSAPWYVSQGIIEKFLYEKADWIFKKLAYFKDHPEAVTTKGSRFDYLRYKEEARARVNARLEYFNQFYGFQWNRVFIRNQKTCWGSCSAKGNLSFNYKIALLPAGVADYVIVHELCHLRELNHSKRFWSLVARTLPHYHKLKKDLRSEIIEKL